MSDTASQSSAELETHLAHQIEFLRASADAFDRGFEAEAKRLALAIRVLVHDTEKSTSLLTLLGRKSMPFYDSAKIPISGNLLPWAGLVVMRVGAGPPRFAPFLENSPGRPGHLVPFDQWWNGVVFTLPGGALLTRRELVLSVANKDGGGHVDPNLDGLYAELSRRNAMGWVERGASGTTAFLGPEQPSVRQVAFEVLRSFGVV